jgi:DNA-binding response OmpR family regulator
MKIALVEDEQKLVRSLKRGLEQAGYVVDSFSNGTEAFEHLEVVHNDYDLAILDRMLPGKDGLQICDDLRQEGINLRIIMLTARGSLDDRVEGLGRGADDYMVKPFAMAELLARIRAVLSRPDSTVPQQLAVGDLTLDPSTRRIGRGGQEINLTT